MSIVFGINITIFRSNSILRGGGGGGVQAYNFGNFNYDVRPRSKNGAKHQNLNQKR